MGVAELPVEVILQEDVVVHLGLGLSGIETGHGAGIVFLESLPLAEIGGAVAVAEHAEGSIGQQPVFVRCGELLESTAAHHAGALLCEDGTGIPVFQMEHLFVVKLREGIEPGGLFFEGSLCLLVAQRADVLQVQVDGMQGHDGDAAVRVGIGPGLGGSGVVDRKQLEQGLSGGCGPVDHQFDVGEVADAGTAAAAEREHGDGRSGIAGMLVGEGRLGDGIGVGPVEAGLPDDGAVRLAADELIFEMGRKERLVQLDTPDNTLGHGHGKGLLGIPRAQRGTAAYEQDLLAMQHPRSDGFDGQCFHIVSFNHSKIMKKFIHLSYGNED